MTDAVPRALNLTLQPLDAKNEVGPFRQVEKRMNLTRAHGSRMQSGTQPVVAAYTFMVLFAMLLWTGTWGMLWLASRMTSPFIVNSTGSRVLDGAILGGGWLFLFLSGPLVTWRYSRQILVDGDRIVVGEWFGLRRRVYERIQVRSIDDGFWFDHGRAVRVQFDNGRRMTVDRYFRNHLVFRSWLAGDV